MLEINKIYNEDCRDGMKKLDENSVDLIITSPPYNIGIDYDSWDDGMDWDDYWRFMRDWIKECFRILKEDGRICINHYLSFGTSEHRVAPLMEINKIALEIGFKHHTVAIWMDRTLAKRTAWGSWLSASAPYINSPFEGILILYKRDWKKHNKGKSTIGKEDFIDLTRGIWNLNTETKGLTKANFPVDLPEKCIRLLSYEGDLVLDPFMGSGTTAEACLRLNRRYIGFELSKAYCEKMKCRTEQERLFALEQQGELNG